MTKQTDRVLWKKAHGFQYEDDGVTPDFSRSKSPLLPTPPMPPELAGRKPSEITQAARDHAERAVPIRRKR